MTKETILQKTNEELNKLVALNKALKSSYSKVLEFINEVDNNNLPASVNKLVMAHASLRGAVNALHDYNERVEGFSFTQEFFIRYYDMQQDMYNNRRELRGVNASSFVVKLYRARVLLTHSELYNLIKHYEEDIKLLQGFVEYVDTLEAC